MTDDEKQTDGDHNLIIDMQSRRYNIVHKSNFYDLLTTRKSRSFCSIYKNRDNTLYFYSFKQ